MKCGEKYSGIRLNVAVFLSDSFGTYGYNGNAIPDLLFCFYFLDCLVQHYCDGQDYGGAVEGISFCVFLVVDAAQASLAVGW